MESPDDPGPVGPRRALLAAAVGGAALLLPACSREQGERREAEEGVSATEDLMREHGVLRRILVVYREAARMLRADAAGVDAGALVAAADLFRRFGEDYHEKILEEMHVFPAVERAGAPAAALLRTLVQQHDRGREINVYLAGRGASGRIGAADVEPAAAALESFARMYESHAAMEDTVVFQAWRRTLSEDQLREAGEQFEAIERQTFKGDGFDIAVDQVGEIERRLGLGDLAGYTAPPVSAG